MSSHRSSRSSRPAALRSEHGAAVGPDRRVAEPGAEPARATPTSSNVGRVDQVGRATAAAPAAAAPDAAGTAAAGTVPANAGTDRSGIGVGGRGPEGVDAARTVVAGAPPPDGDRVADSSASSPASSSDAAASSSSRRSRAPARSWTKAHANAAAWRTREQDDPGLRADRRPDPEPVGDRRVVRVEGRQDDVHVGERRHRQDDVGHPPADRDRGQDHAHREERVAVALMDARRDHEEGERQDGQPDEQGEPVRPPGDDQQDQRDGRQQQRRPDDHRRERPEDGGARRRSRSRSPRNRTPTGPRSPGCGRGRPARAPTGCRR